MRIECDAIQLRFYLDEAVEKPYNLSQEWLENHIKMDKENAQFLDLIS